MLFAIVAVLFALMKWQEIAPVSSLSWWWVGVPVGLAVLWWEVIDPSLGLSKKRESRKMENKKIARQRKMQQDLGLIAPSKDKKRK